MSIGFKRSISPLSSRGHDYVNQVQEVNYVHWVQEVNHVNWVQEVNYVKNMNWIQEVQHVSLDQNGQKCLS